jgi:hypothetical protein
MTMSHNKVGSNDSSYIFALLLPPGEEWCLISQLCMVYLLRHLGWSGSHAMYSFVGLCQKKYLFTCEYVVRYMCDEGNGKVIWDFCQAMSSYTLFWLECQDLVYVLKLKFSPKDDWFSFMTFDNFTFLCPHNSPIIQKDGTQPVYCCSVVSPEHYCLLGIMLDLSQHG